MTTGTTTFMTPQELAARWRGAVTTGTLANWRSKGVGPAFTKLRGRVLYTLAAVEEWEASNLRTGAEEREKEDA